MEETKQLTQCLRCGKDALIKSIQAMYEDESSNEENFFVHVKCIVEMTNFITKLEKSVTFKENDEGTEITFKP